MVTTVCGLLPRSLLLIISVPDGQLQTGKGLGFRRFNFLAHFLSFTSLVSLFGHVNVRYLTFHSHKVTAQCRQKVVRPKGHEKQIPVVESSLESQFGKIVSF